MILTLNFLLNLFLFHELNKKRIVPDNEQLARSGTNCLENLVNSNGAKFDSTTWEATCRCVFDMFAAVAWESTISSPEDEVTSINNPKLSRVVVVSPVKCVVQLELIHTIDNIVFYPATSRKEDLETLALAQAAAATGDGVTSGFSGLMGGSGDVPNVGDQQREEQGMYRLLSSQQLLSLTECLLRAHNQARRANTAVASLSHNK